MTIGRPARGVRGGLLDRHAGAHAGGPGRRRGHHDRAVRELRRAVGGGRRRRGARLPHHQLLVADPARVRGLRRGAAGPPPQSPKARWRRRPTKLPGSWRGAGRERPRSVRGGAQRRGSSAGGAQPVQPQHRPALAGPGPELLDQLPLRLEPAGRTPPAPDSRPRPPSPGRARWSWSPRTARPGRASSAEIVRPLGLARHRHLEAHDAVGHRLEVRAPTGAPARSARRGAACSSRGRWSSRRGCCAASTPAPSARVPAAQRAVEGDRCLSGSHDATASRRPRRVPRSGVPRPGQRAGLHAQPHRQQEEQRHDRQQVAVGELFQVPM